MKNTFLNYINDENFKNNCVGAIVENCIKIHKKQSHTYQIQTIGDTKFFTHTQRLPDSEKYITMEFYYSLGELKITEIIANLFLDKECLQSVNMSLEYTCWFTEKIEKSFFDHAIMELQNSRVCKKQTH